MCFTHDTYSFESVILLSVFLLPELSDTFLIKYLTNVGVLCGPKSLCLLVFTEHKLPECDICLASYLPPYCPNMVTSGFKTPTFQWPEHKIQMQNQRWAHSGNAMFYNLYANCDAHTCNITIIIMMIIITTNKLLLSDFVFALIYQRSAGTNSRHELAGLRHFSLHFRARTRKTLLLLDSRSWIQLNNFRRVRWFSWLGHASSNNWV